MLFTNTDSYKYSQLGLMPKGTSGIWDYTAARKKPCVLFGLQAILLELKNDILSVDEIDIPPSSGIALASTVVEKHGLPFDKEILSGLSRYNNGIRIYSVPEGTEVPAGMPMIWMTSEDPKYYQLIRWLETRLLRVWYPSTIASNGKAMKSILRAAWRESVDDDKMAGLNFALHDFGGRGVTCSEQAQIGGASHQVNFSGTDTTESIEWLIANRYADDVMAFSVPAMEHSIQCAYGPSKEDQEQYFQAVLDRYAKRGAIVSIVIDGYDTFREAATLCNKFKDQIINSGARVVFRPDSGDALEIVPELMQMQALAFSYDTNKKGFDVIRHVGVIQGDGVDANMIGNLSATILNRGFSSENLVFGSGGALLQKVCRDDYGFAQKTSALFNAEKGGWYDTFKDPVTDPGKKSIAGRIWTKVHGDGSCELMTDGNPPEEYLRWTKGDVVNLTTLEDVRMRIGTW